MDPGAEEILADLAYLKPLTEELVCLTGEFAKEFSERKQKKNLLDYSDLEHMALNILVVKIRMRFVRQPWNISGIFGK